jgi:hypothetical protein
LAIQVVADRDEHPVRSLPSLEACETRLERRRILTGPDRAVFEMEVHGRTGNLGWKVEQRRWTPDALAGFGIPVGLRSESVWADETSLAGSWCCGRTDVQHWFLGGPQNKKDWTRVQSPIS